MMLSPVSKKKKKGFCVDAKFDSAVMKLSECRAYKARSTALSFFSLLCGVFKNQEKSPLFLRAFDIHT